MGMYGGCGKSSGEDDEDEKKESDTKPQDMQIDNETSCHDNETSCHDNQVEALDLKTENLENNTQESENEQTLNDLSDRSRSSSKETELTKDLKMSVGESISENNSLNNGDIKEKKVKTELKVNGEHDEKENLVNDEPVKVKRDLDLDLERELKKELKEAVELRVPKTRSRRDERDSKWLSGIDTQRSGERPETPPLQRLMRHEFSPLKPDMTSPSPPKKFRDAPPSLKDGYASKLASVIVPSTSVPVRTASHPKQLLSHSLANLRSSAAMKHFNYSSKPPVSPQSLPSSRPFPPAKPMYLNASEEQPLDLSKKAGGKESLDRSHNFSKSSSRSPLSKDLSKHENGLSSTTLQSLQQKFGGDYHLRGLRKPTSYMLFGPEIPALHQALLHSATMPLPHHSLPMSNGMPRMKHDHSSHHSFRHRNSTPSPSHKVKVEETSKPVKREESVPEKSSKVEKAEKTEKVQVSPSSSSTSGGEDNHTEKYTNHMCTCGKWFDTLYSLSLHLQETGHLPARSKSVSLLEYPKLVRGQDMWLNQESEQTRRILRCIQCGESFKTLPMLTVHMMKTQHYTKIVSSEHARRTHKCSAYCDKEQDKECVFKCKVCQDTFSDMEGLANHMIMSGHHKKQVSPRPPPSLTELQYRQKRKRYYSFEENFFPFGNPKASPVMENRRKVSGSRTSPDCSIDDNSDAEGDSTINCENCGKRIETRMFVDHVRACIGQRLAEDLGFKDRSGPLKELDRMMKLSRSETSNSEERDLMKSPTKKRKLESQDLEHNGIKIEPEDNSKTVNGEGDDVDIMGNGDDKSDEVNDCHSSKNVASPTESNVDSEMDTKDTDATSDIKSIREIQDKDSNNEHSKVSDSDSPDRKLNLMSEDDMDMRESKAKMHELMSKKLDIIDPNTCNSGEDQPSAGSALSAMESFIEKSFSNKFDYKKGNIIINPQSSADATIHHSRPQSSAMNLDTIDYLSKYTKFYSVLHNGLGLESSHHSRSKPKVRSPDEKEKNGLAVKTEGRKSASTPALSDDEKEDGRASVKSYRSNDSGSLDTNENLEKKYLNVLESESSSTKTEGKSSALDNLSSFVYGQPMTSEHPLDSLQRLITKADIPKLMMSHGARAFKYLPPHLQMARGGGSPDLPVPLNLSVKSQNGDGDSDEDEERLRPEDETTLSDYEAAASPANSDGDPVEYRCAACSRRFASKGSYRYHLSRCHLSSVKRYGIKEAFNMSPYVYLPLDHTAKFSKYYEMAKELANKRK